MGGVAVEGGPPIGAGLSSLYQGQLDNSVLAWERITDPIRAVWTGDLAYQEHFERGTQTAYTLASILTLRQADLNTRAYYGFQAQVISGFPWVLDVDVRLGERAGWELDGVIYVDQITAIKRAWDRKTPSSAPCPSGMTGTSKTLWPAHAITERGVWNVRGTTRGRNHIRVKPVKRVDVSKLTPEQRAALGQFIGTASRQPRTWRRCSKPHKPFTRVREVPTVECR